METAQSTLANDTTTELTTPGWLARSIIVDNPGGQWILLPDQSATIAPFTIGAIIPADGTQRVRVSTIAPSGQITSQRGVSATIRLSSEALTPSGGTSVAPGIAPIDANNTFNLISGSTVGPLVAGQTITINLTGNTSYTVPTWITGCQVFTVLNVASALAIVGARWLLQDTISGTIICWGSCEVGATGTTDIARRLSTQYFIPANQTFNLQYLLQRFDGANNWVANNIFTGIIVEGTHALQ